MRDINEMFWNASVEEIKKGYVYEEETDEFVCLICGKTFIKGVIYQEKGMLLEAERAVKDHISCEHKSMFDYLLNMDKRFTGLTDVQKGLLDLFYQGLSDSEIVKKVDAGSNSTIRNHRFALRQKEKQAKVFLAIMELLKERKPDRREDFVDMHKSATMVDERYAITEEENEKILTAYFKEGPDGPLSDFPTKEKRKIAVLRNIVKRFEVGKQYTEKEVNEILKKVYDDYVLLRRYLIEYGFLDRHNDGSAYWVKI